MKTDKTKLIVDNYHTEVPYGFTDTDLIDMLSEYFPEINPEELDLGVNTVSVLEDGRIVRYHCDIERSIRLHLSKHKTNK